MRTGDHRSPHQLRLRHHFRWTDYWERSASTTHHHTRRTAPQAALHLEFLVYPSYRTSPERVTASRLPTSPYPQAMSFPAHASTIPGAWSLDPPHLGNVAAPRTG